jgi:subtilisin family serine protease
MNQVSMKLGTLISCCGLVATHSSIAASSADEPPVLFNEPVSSEVVEEPNGLMQQGSDPLRSEQWYLENSGQLGSKGTPGVVGADIGFPNNLDDYPVKEPLTLAIIDTGLNFEHPDLNLDRMFINAGESGLDSDGNDKATNGRDDDNNGFVDDVRGWSFADGGPSLPDGRRHGTHLTGLMTARTDNSIGIAAPWRGFNVLPIQIFSSAHPSVPTEKIAAAVHYAVDMGAKVISASFGTPSFSQVMADAVAYANAHDVLFVSATGNFRRNLDIEPNYPSGYGFPNQIAVGSSDRRDLFSSFSNFGTAVDIASPGEEIVSLSDKNGYLSTYGTSQATPLVSATAAMLRALYPELSAPQIKDRILQGADEKIGLKNFTISGRRLNVANAVAGRLGLRLPSYDVGQWPSTSLVLESEHPYRANLNQRFMVKAPSGSVRFRLHFSRLQTQSSDILFINTRAGTTLIQMSGEMGAFWTPVIEGDEAELLFKTDSIGLDWGFAVDALSFQGEER